MPCLIQSELSDDRSSPRPAPVSTAWDGDRLTCAHLRGSSLQQELPTLLIHMAVTLQEPGGDRRTPKALHKERPAPQGQSHVWRGMFTSAGRVCVFSLLQATESYRAQTTRHSGTCWRHRCDQPALVITYRPDVTYRAGGVRADFQRKSQQLRPRGGAGKLARCPERGPGRSHRGRKRHGNRACA